MSDNSRTAALVEYLADRRLVFIKGIPPKTEDGTLLAWTGGCNALVCCWNGKHLTKWGGGDIVLADVLCWMRLPHPSIWPEVSLRLPSVPVSDLYSANDHALKTWQDKR
jgi:hypothetical protein